MTTPKERMSEEQLRWAREGLADPLPYSNESARDEISRLLNHIDALRAELTAARTVEDGEVLRHVKWLLTGCVDWDGSRMVDGEIPKGEIKCGDFRQIADLLTRLSAAKAEAERERDEARLLAEQLEANILREEKAHERTIFQRDEAEECVSDIYFATMGEAPEWSNNFGFKDALADIKGAHKLLGDALRAAQSALAQAREAALEEAARACETLTGSDATPTLRPGARMCLHRIRALKTTQERGTQKGTQMNDETAWLIERGDTTTSAPKYLMVTGGNIDQTELCTGTFQWTTINHHALRFSRRVDANLFVAAIRYLSDSLPHGKTLPGLRSGDLSPRVCEHQWITPTQESETP